MTADLSAAVEAARADLAAVDRQLADLWEHLYAPDGPAPEGVRKEKRKRSGSPELWAGAKQVQSAYNDVLDEIARAHWVLGRGTDVPAHYWARKPSGEWSQDSGLPKWRKPTVPHTEARRMVALLDAMLAWLADNPPAKQGPLAEAAGHVSAALGRIDDLWKQPPPPVDECGNCGSTKGLKRRDPPRCEPCTKYLMRNNRERPRSLWHAA